MYSYAEQTETPNTNFESFRIVRQANSGASTFEANAGLPEQPVHEEDAHLQI